MTKAGTVVESIPNPESHVALILRYKSTYARVLDANRKFLQAAQRYHDLSQTATDMIDADDVLNMLGRAATCAILAPSGPQRQRVLGHVRQLRCNLSLTCSVRANSLFSRPLLLIRSTKTLGCDNSMLFLRFKPIPRLSQKCIKTKFLAKRN